MNSKTIAVKIKMVSLDKGIRQAELARRAGYSPEAFAVKLSRGILSIDKASEILDELGCELVVVDKETKKVY